jgi:RNA polymerase sigma factor (TIGR02999 family)
MAMDESVTKWLDLWREGDPQAMEGLTRLVYQDLRRLAAYHLRGESDAASLQATALVHEVYLRMPSLRSIDWKGRGHFISVVTQVMRRVLVDHARARKAAKRDAREAAPIPVAVEPASFDILAVDEALLKMAQHHPRCTYIVELRFFGDLEFSEIAEALDISLTTVERDWRFSRAWLEKAMRRGASLP